jgi:hypothetical protein
LVANFTDPLLPGRSLNELANSPEDYFDMPLHIYVCRYLQLAVLASSVLFFAEPSGADSPFNSMRGSWSGDGAITLSNGAQERIRCRASYSPSGPSLRMSLVCASDSYKVDLTSQITSSGGEIKGTWAEASRNVNGEVAGTTAGSTIQLTAKSALFSASLLVKTNGRNQTISITAPGTEVSRVAIALKR